MYFDTLVGSQFEPGAEGQATVHLALREEHHGPHGFVHGGVLCTLAHQSAGAAVYSLCKPGQEAVMLGMSINFLKAAWTGSLHSRSGVIRQGSHTSVVQTCITGEDDQPRAVATSTFMIRERALRPPA